MAPRIDYYFRETVVGLRRNGVIAFAAVSTVFISLFLFGGAQLIGRQINRVIDYQTERVEVAVFLNDNISNDDLARIRGLLGQMPEVADLRYESKAQAFQRAQGLFANQPDLIRNVSKDAFPASFRVKLNNPERNYPIIAARLQGQPGIENIVDERDVLKRLFAVSDVLKTGAYIASAVMLLSAIALIANTVRMAVFARRKEIGIMRLVGATNWFIRIPFMIEALVEGLLGALVAIIVLVILQREFFSKFHSVLSFIPVVGSHDVITLIPWLLAGGGLVAILASLLAMRRFLEV